MDNANHQTYLMPLPSPDPFLETSPAEADGDKKVGRLPAEIPIADLRRLGHPERPTKAIRAKCIDCSGGSRSEVRKCTAFNCALWPFRMGVSPFYGSRTGADVEDAQLTPLE